MSRRCYHKEEYDYCRICGPNIEAREALWRVGTLEGEVKKLREALGKAKAALQKRSGYNAVREYPVAGARGQGHCVYKTWRCCGEQHDHDEIEGKIVKQSKHECDVGDALTSISRVLGDGA